jgi:hypothetical protein
MHRDVVTHICVSKPTEFVVTASNDGHVKFWKKMAETIEFVKHYQAHLGTVVDTISYNTIQLYIAFFSRLYLLARDVSGQQTAGDHGGGQIHQILRDLRYHLIP